ncbi:non-ribosomal peptide synthetase-like protein [Kibdelosporangium banguiense]|uniref:Non-ribosomal peptide synthetase-like protein n=1 Tax=Kibdelosporangium banguiense TaxID=1365924 RepID=A0ABS4TW28_9PSEU|nr:Pls/PosA family non-ribosomal peptide synthetase [Kibdelosporangium banguiense]MBP2328600.1 non-ribosomal peptide synthetase-like protein [Kibdelosporangium banguiense]
MGKTVEVPTVDLAESSTTDGAHVGPAAGVERMFTDVLAEVLRVEQVPADSHFFDDLGADSMVMAQFCARVRKRPDLPSVSIKDIYQHPTIRSLAAALADTAPVPVERMFTDVLAEVLRVEQVPADSHFFDDLGADSMVMAQFCARVRKQPDLPSVSIKDIYQHPTIRSLAAALADTTPAAGGSPVPATTEVTTPVSTRQYVLCGALQFLFLLGYSYLTALVLELGFEWISAGSDVVHVYLRSVLFGGAFFLGMSTLPILVKWVLIGRWKPQRIRIWSLAYVRFWVVKTLVGLNPLVLFAGSPLYVLYLRALGARVGRGVVVFSRHAPVCTDLLTIGEGTVIRKDAFLTGYRACAGWIQTGAVTLGRDVFVGEATVLDIETSLGDGAQLGHASSLHAGQAVPEGERWHGSPAQPAEADYRGVEPAGCGAGRRAVYTVLQLLKALALQLPLVYGGVAILFTEVPRLAALLGNEPLAFTSWTFYSDALAVSLVLFFGSALVRLLVMVAVPRVLNLAIKPGKVYRLYGIHYALHRAIARLTNIQFFKTLFGDSSCIVHYLRCMGYRLAPVVQTGSNFGNLVKHETPYLSAVGSGTVVASGLSIANVDFSSTSFRVSRASIGARNFLGNWIVYPAQGRTGENCLLATKVLVPIDGLLREGVGLLGSPSFEIPRTVERDTKFNHLASGDDLPRRLAAKNKHNAVSMGWFLLSRWCYAFLVVLIALGAADLYHSLGASAIALATVLIFLFGTLYFVLVERAATGFRGVRPTYCSIYQIDFWRTERFYKLFVPAGVHAVFNGTPFKAVIWRLLGVRLGKRLFDDGSDLDEKNLVTIGDDCMLNAGSHIQCHSQEDFAFKSDRTVIGSGCTVGTGALVHYGVTMGDGAVLAPDSFLMKGEEMPPHARWGGNPARQMRDALAGSRVLRDHNDNAAVVTSGTRREAAPGT